VPARALQPFDVAIVVDGPWQRNAAALELFQQEITELAKDDADIRFREPFAGDWTLATVRGALDRALADREVDLVLALGVLAAHDACNRSVLAKPVIAAGVIDPATQGLPAKDGASGVKNLAYVTVPSAYDRDLRVFLDVARFRQVAILSSGYVVESIPALAGRLASHATALGLTPTIVPVGESAADALARIPEEVEAVYLMPQLQLPDGETDRLIAGINERRLPSFSALGELEVRRGVLASATPEIFPKMARRVAVTLHRILRGEDAGTLPTTFAVGEQLFLNAATMRAIGASPAWAILTEAEIVGDDGSTPARRLSLVTAMAEAIAANRDLAAAERRVAAGKEEIGRARSPLLTETQIDARGTVIDEDRAASSFGAQPERSLSGGLSLSQALLSEPALANLSVQRHLQRARERELDANRIDVAEDVATAYLDVLRALTLERIRRENLRLTRHHLELARTREEIGASGRSDVLRWESELATNRKAAIDANASRNLAEMELNRILHRPLEESVRLDDAIVDSSGVLELLGPTIPWWQNKRTFQAFREFLAQEAVAASPELAQLDASIAAAARRESSAKRAFWLPNVGLGGSVRRELDASGAGTEPPAAFEGLDLEPADETTWSVELQATLPLFQQERFAERSQAREERRRLEEEREAARQRIEVRVRAASHRAGASYAGIRETRAALDAARQNLDLVTDAYSRGAVPLIDVLDAQNSFVVAGEAADDAVYDFLQDVVAVERALGRFAFQRTAEEKQVFRSRLAAFLDAGEISEERE
jgi:outer membrane protein TolC/ABC-type uncharacterized transport system substrate-binding protein